MEIHTYFDSYDDAIASLISVSLKHRKSTIFSVFIPCKHIQSHLNPNISLQYWVVTRSLDLYAPIDTDEIITKKLMKHAETT